MSDRFTHGDRRVDPRVLKQIADLRERFPSARLVRRGEYLFVRLSMDLPEPWRPRATDIMFQVPVGYPIACPIDFFTPKRVERAPGIGPYMTGYVAPAGWRRKWLKWSVRCTAWDPNSHTLLTWVRVIQSRFTTSFGARWNDGGGAKAEEGDR